MRQPDVRFVALIAVVGMLGCGDPQADRLSQTTEVVTWEATDALYTPELMGGVDISFEMGDPSAAFSVVASEEFKAAVDQIESGTLPSAWSDRTAQRDALVQALRELIAAAESSNLPEFTAAYEKVQEAGPELMGSN